MTTVAEVLDRLVAGQITLDAAAADFRSRRWAKLPKTSEAQAWGVQDDTPASANSWDTVNRDSRLTSEQYQTLARAYEQATSGVAASPEEPPLF